MFIYYQCLTLCIQDQISFDIYVTILQISDWACTIVFSSYLDNDVLFLVNLNWIILHIIDPSPTEWCKINWIHQNAIESIEKQLYAIPIIPTKTQTWTSWYLFNCIIIIITSYFYNPVHEQPSPPQYIITKPMIRSSKMPISY